MLNVIERAAVHMLARCFQNYHALSDNALSGIMTDNTAAAESPAPIMHHAVKLAGMQLYITQPLRDTPPRRHQQIHLCHAPLHVSARNEKEVSKN